MVTSRSWRKALLSSLIGALAVGALVGIYVFVVGDFGETEIKILVTTLSLTFFSVTSLGCTAVLETKRGVWLAVPGLAVSLFGFGWSLGVIWPEWDADPMWKTMVVLALLAFSLAQACLLALPRLKVRFRWLLAAGMACIFSFAVLISLMVVFEWEDELLFRLAGVLGILDACATLAIPILYKLTGKAPLEPVQPTAVTDGDDLRIELSCPRCGQGGVYPVGMIECPECSLRIRVEVAEPGGAQVAGRRRAGGFQFSLKALLLAFVVVSLPLGWIGFRMGQLRRQAAVIEALAPFKPQVFYRYGNATSIRITTVDQTKFDASLLARLKELPKLQSLYLSYVPITDDDLVFLEGLDVRWVQLEKTRLTGAAVQRLKKIHPNWSVSIDTNPTGPAERPVTNAVGDASSRRHARQ